MRLTDVLDRFTLISGLKPSEVSKWTTVCIDAMNQIKSRIVKGVILSESDALRLSACAAALAYHKYTLCISGDDVESFTAGSLNVKMSGKEEERAKKLLRVELESASDLLQINDDFSFQGVRV